MKRSILAVVVALASVGAVLANDYNVGALESNLYVNAGAGVDRAAGKNRLFETTGFALGLPVTNINNIVIGAQVGADTQATQKNAQDIMSATATTGLFARNIQIWQGHQVALAALFDYDYTDNNRNLVSFRPVAGVTLDSKDEVGVTATAHVTSDRGAYPDEGITAFWTRDWTSRFTTQARVGWAFGSQDVVINEPAGGASVEYRLTKNLSVILAGDVKGNHDCVASFSFVIGGKGQSGSDLSQIAGTGLNPMNR